MESVPQLGNSYRYRQVLRTIPAVPHHTSAIHPRHTPTHTPALYTRVRYQRRTPTHTPASHTPTLYTSVTHRRIHKRHTPTLYTSVIHRRYTSAPHRHYTRRYGHGPALCHIIKFGATDTDQRYAILTNLIDLNLRQADPNNKSHPSPGHRLMDEARNLTQTCIGMH